MDCAAQTTDCLVRSQVQSKDKLQVSGVALANYRTFGYLCGNIIYANYASSCEGA